MSEEGNQTLKAMADARSRLESEMLFGSTITTSSSPLTSSEPLTWTSPKLDAYIDKPTHTRSTLYGVPLPRRNGVAEFLFYGDIKNDEYIDSHARKQLRKDKYKAFIKVDDKNGYRRNPNVLKNPGAIINHLKRVFFYSYEYVGGKKRLLVIKYANSGTAALWDLFETEFFQRQAVFIDMANKRIYFDLNYDTTLEVLENDIELKVRRKGTASNLWSDRRKLVSKLKKVFMAKLVILIDSILSRLSRLRLLKFKRK